MLEKVLCETYPPSDISNEHFHLIRLNIVSCKNDTNHLNREKILHLAVHLHSCSYQEIPQHHEHLK